MHWIIQFQYEQWEEPENALNRLHAKRFDKDGTEEIIKDILRLNLPSAGGWGVCRNSHVYGCGSACKIEFKHTKYKTYIRGCKIYMIDFTIST